MAGATERVFVAPPIPTGGGKVIAAPFQFYTTGEDNLRVVSVNSLTGVSLVIQGRLVDNTGKLTAASWSHTPNSNRTTKTTEIALAPGAVLNLTVFANAGSPSVGQTFVMVQLIRGSGAAAVVLGTLLQGYVTSTQALAWPGSPLISSTDGEPTVRNILGATPAVGSGSTETCPTGARWELVSVWASLTTSAAAGSRIVFLQTSLSSGPGGVYLEGGSCGPSTFTEYSFAQNLPLNQLQSVGFSLIPFAQRAFLRAADSFTVNCLSRDAGDQFSAPSYQVREWLEVA